VLDGRLLLFDDFQQMLDHMAHDERGLLPTGGIKQKPCWKRERDYHRTPHTMQLEAL
jgi:hypothetical protein